MVGGSQKIVENRFFQALPNVTPNVWGGKEPGFKSFPGLKRVITDYYGSAPKPPGLLLTGYSWKISEKHRLEARRSPPIFRKISEKHRLEVRRSPPKK